MTARFPGIKRNTRGHRPRLQDMKTQTHKVIRLILVFVCVFVAFAISALAHDIPADITIQSFLKPEGRQLHLLLRVPLKAMRDIEFPKSVGKSNAVFLMGRAQRCCNLVAQNRFSCEGLDWTEPSTRSGRRQIISKKKIWG
jgi:hypothetical protein